MKKILFLEVSKQWTWGVLHMCDGVPVPRQLGMSIKNGAFSVSSTFSPGSTWGLRGHFTTPTSASAHFDGQGVWDGKSGNVTFTTT